MFVSIIIPIYNVAPYIEQCLKSVMAQSYRNLEVLLIDDCGTDNSIDIVRGLIGGEDSIIEGITYRILHHEHNRGLSAARNTGIKEAHGNLLYFLDSDDCIERECISNLVASYLSEPNIDVVVGNYSSSDGKQLAGDITIPPGVYDKDLIHLYLSRTYPMTVWNKLVRASFLRDNNLYFEEGLIHEDELWSLQVACKLKKMAVISDVTYFYLIRSGSLAQIPDQKLHEYHCACVNARIGEFVSSDSSLKKNVELYTWIEKDRYRRLMEPGWNEHVDIFMKIYRLYRDTKYWNLIDLLFLPSKYVTFGAILRSFHTFFPYRYGYPWFVKIYNRYGI